MPKGTIELSLLLLLAPLSAQATGLCENNPTLITLLAFSERARAVALTVENHWCKETEEMEEVRGVSQYVEVRGLDDKVVARYGARAVEGLEGPFTVMSPDKMRERLKADGFDLASGSGAAKGVCTVGHAVGKAGAGEAGWPEVDVTLRVSQGKRVILSRVTGQAAEARGEDVDVRAFFLPKERSLAVWARLPLCEGPPPGYFSEDDGGDCYRLDGASLTVLTVTEVPALAPCFPAQGAKP